MKKYLQIVDRFTVYLGWLAKICTVISGVCLIFIVLTFGWLVYGRYVLNFTPTWVEQLALLLIVVITFLSSAVGIKERTHLSVEIVPSALPDKIRPMLNILISLIVGGFGLIMMVESYALTTFNWSTEIPLLSIPEGVRTIPAVASGFLLCVFSLGNILRDLGAKNSANPLEFVEDHYPSRAKDISEKKF